jgi:magnesium-protoporphyrin O-methyltransferase
MSHVPYQDRRSQIEDYFDRTAADAWAKLTSSAPVSGIRATVRAGRDRMRATMLSWLPPSLEGRRILDAGCGTGLMAVELARRGAEVLAIDLSPRMIELARERLPADIDPSRIDFRSGDMLDEELGYFDHVVAMDSLIHYEPSDVVRALGALSARTVDSMVIPFAPRTPLRRSGVSPLRPRTGHRAGRRADAGDGRGRLRRAAGLEQGPHRAHQQRVLHLAGD